MIKMISMASFKCDMSHTFQCVKWTQLLIYGVLFSHLFLFIFTPLTFRKISLKLKLIATWLKSSTDFCCSLSGALHHFCKMSY